MEDEYFVEEFGRVVRYAPQSCAYVYEKNGQKGYLYRGKDGIFYASYPEACRVKRSTPDD